MKVKSLQFRGHPLFQDLLVDFADPVTGLVADTIVVAGENGCGKTQLLNEIYIALTEPLHANRSEATMVLELDVTNLQDASRAASTSSIGKTVSVSYRKTTDGGWNNIELLDNSTGFSPKTGAHFFFQGSGRRPFRAFFSEAAVGFSSNAPGSITATTVDAENVFARKSGTDLAQQIAQLLVDIRAADLEDLGVWVQRHPGQVPPSGLGITRMQRFIDAIEYMMPSKRFDTISRETGQHQITFTEFGRRTTLDQLSTGEKQIIFRGGFILRDLASILGGVVLVDEPELSLHPDWQRRILGFYQRLLPQTVERSTQLIVATHSPFIVHDQASAKVIVLSKNKSTGAVQVDPTPSYPGAGGLVLVQAFDVQSMLQKVDHETIVLVEGRSDQHIIETAWQKLTPGKTMPFEIRALLGDRNIQRTLNDDQVFKTNTDKKLVGLFDFDSGYNEWNGVWAKGVIGILAEADAVKGLLKRHPTETGWAMLLPVPATRQHLASEALGGLSALSIELMFDDTYHLAGMIEQQPLPAPDATKPVMRTRMKSKFATHVTSLPTEAFVAFRPLFHRLESIAGSPA